MICYEHPLNERIRTLLRLEDLFDKIIFLIDKDDAIEHHSALVTLFEILDVASRAHVGNRTDERVDQARRRLGFTPEALAERVTKHIG